MGFTFGVQGEASDFALHVTLGGLVTIVFGSARAELENVVPRLQLIGKITEEVAERGLVLIGRALEEHD